VAFTNERQFKSFFKSHFGVSFFLFLICRPETKKSVSSFLKMDEKFKRLCVAWNVHCSFIHSAEDYKLISPLHIYNMTLKNFLEYHTAKGNGRLEYVFLDETPLQPTHKDYPHASKQAVQKHLFYFCFFNEKAEKEEELKELVDLAKKNAARFVYWVTPDKKDWRSQLLLNVKAKEGIEILHDSLDSLLRSSKNLEECEKRWAIRTTMLRMCQARQWTVLSPSPQLMQADFMGMSPATQMQEQMIFVAQDQQKEICILLYRPVLRLPFLRNYLKAFQDEDAPIRQIVLIATKISPMVMSWIDNERKKNDPQQKPLKINVFDSTSFAFPVIEHEWQPSKIRILSPPEKALVLQRFHASKLNQMEIDDPLVQFIGASIGDILHVISYSQHIGEEEDYFSVGWHPDVKKRQVTKIPLKLMPPKEGEQKMDTSSSSSAISGMDEDLEQAKQLAALFDQTSSDNHLLHTSTLMNLLDDSFVLL
jgi:DNA-directed RNA polymerase subunit H (RpoH/RPB5)